MFGRSWNEEDTIPGMFVKRVCGYRFVIKFIGNKVARTRTTTPCVKRCLILKRFLIFSSTVNKKIRPEIRNLKKGLVATDYCHDIFLIMFDHLFYLK
jgi:hypothetical protein